MTAATFDAKYLCEIPRALGRITALENVGGRVVAHTESGVDFICPTGEPHPHVDLPCDVEPEGA